jgi:hypothetical protein
MQVNVQKKTGKKKYIKLSKYNKNINEGGGNMSDSFFSNNLNSDRDGIVEYTDKELRDN